MHKQFSRPLALGGIAVAALALGGLGTAAGSALLNGRNLKPGTVGMAQLAPSVRHALSARTTANLPGPQGPAGAQGIPGPQGTQGAAGPQGAPGATRVSLGKTESIVLPALKGAGFLNLRCQDGGYPVSAAFGATPDGVLFSGSTPTRQGDVLGFTVYLSNVGTQPATVTARAVCVP